MNEQLNSVISFAYLSKNNPVIYSTFSNYTSGKEKLNNISKRSTEISTENFLADFSKIYNSYNKSINREHYLELSTSEDILSAQMYKNYQNISDKLNNNIVLFDIGSLLFIRQENIRAFLSIKTVYLMRFHIWFKQDSYYIKATIKINSAFNNVTYNIHFYPKKLKRKSLSVISYINIDTDNPFNINLLLSIYFELKQIIQNP